MRALGFTLLLFGFLWASFAQFRVSGGGAIRFVAEVQYSKLSKNPTKTYDSQEAQQIILDTAILSEHTFPNIMWPSALMLLGGLVLGFARRRSTSGGA